MLLRAVAVVAAVALVAEAEEEFLNVVASGMTLEGASYRSLATPSVREGDAPLRKVGRANCLKLLRASFV
jgi:hypothetical protein